VFDLWSVLTTLERGHALPERSWLFCRLVEWISHTRSGIWTYYEATSKVDQTRVSTAIQRYPALQPISEYYDRGMRTWTSEAEIGKVDAWIDSNESWIHSTLMDIARADKTSVMQWNAGPVDS